MPHKSPLDESRGRGFQSLLRGRALGSQEVVSLQLQELQRVCRDQDQDPCEPQSGVSVVLGFGGGPWRKPRPAPRRALGAGPSAFRAGGRAYRARAEWPRPTGLRGKGWFRAVGKGGATQPSLTWAAAAAAGSREVA